MSINVYTVSQVARQLGVSSVAVTTRIIRNSLPEGVTAQKVGSNWNIYIPEGKKLERQLAGNSTDRQRPGRNCKWVLVDG